MQLIKNNSPPENRLSVTPASYLLLKRANEVLLLRRFNTGYSDGNWSLPSGHFDGGETAINTAIREAKEEIGIDVSAEDLKFVHVIHRVAQEGGYERVDFFFEADKWEGKPTITEPDKCDALEWFNLDNLPSNMTEEPKQALEHIKKGEYFSTIGF